MSGLDQAIAQLSDGATVVVVICVAIVLGLRHATDPDHLAAVATLVASGRERTQRRATSLGFCWGAGHATSLFVFGVPIVLFQAYLPEPVQRAAETAVGVLIVTLAVWLLVRWRRGVFHVHTHEHDGSRHVHLHSHSTGRHHAHRHSIRTRSPLGAYGIGLVHGMAGSAGVGVLLLASIRDQVLAVTALALFALFTAVSMSLVSTGFGIVLSGRRARASFDRLALALGSASLLFGGWYALGAVQLAPH
jgi:ABC-type nickel/cobalt efflux system permease component RcnA